MSIKRQYLKVLFWFLAITVLVLSILPGSITYTIKHVDKFAHFFTFFVLSILLLCAYKFSKPFFATASFMALFGLAIEVLHLYIPNRVFSMYDFTADVFGILAAFVAYKVLNNKLELA